MDNRREAKANWITGGTAAQGYIAAPGNAATITLWDSNADGRNKSQGTRYKRVIANIYSSAASGTNGLSFQESADDGANWDELASYTVAATTYTKSVVGMSAHRTRVRYTNSAAVLTAFRGGIIVDEYDNASQ